MSCSKTGKQATKNLIFRRSKTQDRSQKMRQQRSLEKMACLSLCELSQSIDAQHIKPQSNNKSQKFVCSPWKAKIQQSDCDKEAAKINRKISPNIQTQLRPYQKENKETNLFTKHNSIFVKLKTAKQSKDLTEIKSLQLKKVKILQDFDMGKVQGQKYLKIVLNEKNENLPSNPMSKIEKLEITKKKSANLLRKIPCCFFQLDKQYRDRQNKVEKTPTTDYWKARKVNIKTKKFKQQPKPTQNRNKSTDKKQNQQKSARMKRLSFIQKSYKEEYKSTNPFTKLLYEKFIDTISISHPVKDCKIDFL